MKGLILIALCIWFPFLLAACGETTTYNTRNDSGSSSTGTKNEKNAEYVLYAVSAGKADALLLKTGSYNWLIDTGYTRSRGKILYAMNLLGMDQLDGVFITHTDSDHTEGLEWLAESDIPVDAWYAPAFHTEVKQGKHPAEKAAKIRNDRVTWLKAGDRFDLGEASLEALAPGVLIDDKDNNNSLVMMLHTPYGNMLLCGDMEYRQEKWLMDSGADLKCDVIKIPNHADNDVCSPSFLLAASPTVAVISTDTSEKSDTPDPKLMKRLKKICPTIIQTQDTNGGVMISLLPGEIRTAYIPLPDVNENVVIESVNPVTDTITIQNEGNEEIDLSGWYMITDKKKAYFAFPDHAVLNPGQKTVVGSKSAKFSDYIWKEKKIINGKKEDGVTLYDQVGNVVSYIENGQ